MLSADPTGSGGFKVWRAPKPVDKLEDIVGP